LLFPSWRDEKESNCGFHRECDTPATDRTTRGIEFIDRTEQGRAPRLESPSAPARARADEIIEAHDRWHAKYWRYPGEVRSPERQADRLSRLKDRLRAKIDRTRAHTIAGLAVKAQVAAIEGEGDTQFADTTLESIRRDIPSSIWRRCHEAGRSAVDEAEVAR
jgi:hypothetical protein